MKAHSSATLTAIRCAFIFFVVLAHGAVCDDAPLSARRLALAEQLATEFFANHDLDTDIGAAVKSLLPAFQQRSPQQPAALLGNLPAEEDFPILVEQELTRLANRDIPAPSKRQLRIEAAEKYPIYQPGDKVKVIYRANPRYSAAYEGTYQGRSIAYLRVGARIINIEDMIGLEGNYTELLKFDQEESERLRQQFIDSQIDQHKEEQDDYKAAKRKQVAQQVRAAQQEANEKAGYTLVQQAWLTPEQLLTISLEKSRWQKQHHLARQDNQQRLAAIAAIEGQANSLAAQNTFAPATERLNPEQALRQQQREAQEAADATAKKLAEAEEAKRKASEQEEERQRQEEEQKRLAEARQRQAETKVPETESVAPEKTPPHLIILAVIIGLIVLGGLGTTIAVIIQKKRSKDTFKKFFAGRGKLQKDFWAMAEADPEHFKYVAYMFPDLKEANSALQKLSYIRSSPNGDLRSTRDILFGAYPHLEGAVCFVGGINLHYALWREASAVLPELPNAVYFKVSTEPNVQLEIPDINDLADKDIHVENLGVQELAGEGGEFTRCYRYRTNTKKAALAFLESFVVNEEGIIIHVETDEGIWGKDENGVFEVQG